MAFSQAGTLAFATAAAGILSFVLGIVAENKKPASGIATQQGDLTVCIYQSDHYVALSVLSMVLLAIASVFGVLSILYPYNNISVPLASLTRSKLLVVFLMLSSILFFVSEGLMMWAAVTENMHHVHHIHTTTECPTAKTGLMGGAAFLALDTTLFWLVCQMLTMNAREDHLEAYGDDDKGSYGQVLASEYGPVSNHSGAKA